MQQGSENAEGNEEERASRDGRKAMLVYMKPGIIEAEGRCDGRRSERLAIRGEGRRAGAEVEKGVIFSGFAQLLHAILMPCAPAGCSIASRTVAATALRRE